MTRPVNREARQTSDLPIEAGRSLGETRVALLGVGGFHGHDYKLGLVRRVREAVAELVVIEEEDHWARKPLAAEVGVHGTIQLRRGSSTTEAVETIETSLRELGFSPDAVLTYRQEWLPLRAALARVWRLPGPPEAAVALAANKFRTKTVLKSLGLDVPAFNVLSYEDVANGASIPEYPAFIRPNVGIRSEWARAIETPEDLRDYAADVARSDRSDQQYLVESLLRGHEVDVDLFLHGGRVVYAKASDNLPVRAPFALETGHLMPSLLPNDIQARLVDVASAASQATGFRDGNIHVDLILLPDGRVFVVEVNGRLGGMYIADWHKRVWGVDLALAELAVSLGAAPTQFLQFRSPSVALAQVCLTAPLPPSRSTVSRWVFFDPAAHAKRPNAHVVIEGWYQAPQEEHIVVAGPLNLGALTVSGASPAEAFDRLMDVAHSCALRVAVNGVNQPVDLTALSSFCGTSPIQRYVIRPFGGRDRAVLTKLMELLTPHANHLSTDWTVTDPEAATPRLCIVDNLRPDLGIIGTIAVHFWHRARVGHPLCGYLHDMVVAPEYRGAGLGHQLIDAAIGLAKSMNCYKVYLDSDASFRQFYEAHGFSVAGDCMVQYLYP